MSKEKQIEAEELFSILFNTINGADFDDLYEAVYKILDVAKYRKQSEWISVDKRLPEDMYGKDRKKITVLVCTESGNVSTTSRQRIVKFDKDKLEWVELDTFEWSKRKQVTHWMPLPEAPKNQN